MKKISNILLMSLMVVFLSIGSAYATLIVDTGAPAAIFGSSLDDSQWLAAEFTTSQDFIVNGVYGWLRPDNGASATAAIYADDYVGSDVQSQPATGLIPGTELFSSPFSTAGTEGWYGPSGLNWSLPAGTYWVAYEVLSGQTFDGIMRSGVPNPLSLMAFTMPPSGEWSKGLSAPGFGVRIDASSPVPEPATMLLFGSGLLGLVGFRRKLKK